MPRRTDADAVDASTAQSAPGAAHAPRCDSSPGAAVDDSADDWGRLMARAQDGDRAAYHALLTEITPYVRVIARRCLGATCDVEDAVQEILLVVHRIRHTYERGRPFKPWLGTIASRRAVDLGRRRAHRALHELPGEDDAMAAEPDTGDGPEDASLRRQQHDHILQAVARLPQRQREAVEYVRLRDGAPSTGDHDVIALPGALRVAYHRALRSLKAALSPDAPAK